MFTRCSRTCQVGKRQTFTDWDRILHSPPAGGTTWSSSFMLVRFQIFLIIALSSSLACSRLPAGWKSSETGIKPEPVEEQFRMSSVAISGGNTRAFAVVESFGQNRHSDHCWSPLIKTVTKYAQSSQSRKATVLLFVSRSQKLGNYNAPLSWKMKVSFSTYTF